MNYYYPTTLSYHWNDIAQMINENYAHEYEHNDLLIMAIHHHHSIEKIKSENPGHGKIIIYQLEPLNKSHWWSEDHIIPILKDADEVWDYDLDNIKKLKSHGIDAKFKPFLYTEGLKRIKNSPEPDIDILFYGTLSDYRYKFLEKINHFGIKVGTTVCAFALTKEILDEFIGRSKIIIDLQLNDKEKFIQKQTRLYYALINDKCVLSTKSSRNYYGDLILEADNNIDDVLNQATFLLTTEKWKDYSNNSERFKQITINDMFINSCEPENKFKLEKIKEIQTAWTDHIDFAQWIVKRIDSKVVVDLGVDYAYSTFCFAFPKIGHVFGIDSFDGDLHADFRDTYKFVNEKKKELGMENITFIKGYFDDIAKTWDKPIDILHIDGFHSYEAVKNDYETWSKFLKEDGIVLFHDTCVEDRDFGVKKFFEEIDLPKVNFTSSYGLGIVSKNISLIKEISDTFNIPLYKTNTNKKLVIFYHLYQTNNWEELFQEQINSLVQSGLYDKCEFIHVGINGDQELPFVLNKMRINYNENKILEANTLQKLWEFSKDNQDYKVLYFHSKGVTHTHDEHYFITTTSWRIYLEYFVINKWEECVEDLNEYDCVGTEWVNESRLWDSDLNDYSNEINPHYSGNFWWANSSYISKLDLKYIYNEEKEWTRWKSEFWIGTKNPKYKSYHNSNKPQLYDFNYTPDYYINDKKINLIKEPMNKVFIITPCTRPFNLQKISQSIPQECEWVVVLDAKVNHDHQVDNAHVVKSPLSNFRGYPNKSFGLDYIKNELNPSDNDWVYILHDDNIIHPQWYNSIKEELNSTNSVITWGQCFHDETSRLSPVEFPQVGNIDTSQYMVRWNVAKNLRFEQVYEADGIYAEEASKQGSVKKLDQCLAYYNYLRAHKSQQEIRANVCMISMFKNEAKGIRRMLESVWRHIDFYVFQDNGSTDGTPDIVREFFADKNIPGFIYEVEEGWVGFGWNRDHLLQTTLGNDHGCDWIMKMDCDEYLEVDDDFDWSPFFNTDIECFNVTAKAPGCIYYRTWIWNAKLPWKFKHDVAHECIYLDNGRGEDYHSESLPRGLRMIGTSDGESYTVRTKYISDALKLEEKLIREDTMLTDLYHFWYTAKSYHDCYAGDFYPLSRDHSEEFARRFIFYYKKYLEVINAQGIHEMSYFSTFAIGEGYEYLKDYQEAIRWYQDAEKYCPERNEHIVCLARLYDKLGQHEKMLEQTSRLVDPSRKLPFPQYCFLLNDNIYSDSGGYPKYLHDYALSKVSEEKTVNSFSVNIQTKPRLWIVDNFYADPHAVREFALKQEFEANLNYYKGSRSVNQYDIPGTKEAFEKILGFKIKNWTETHGMCSRFQYCTAEDDLVYHCDSQTWAGMIYLTPDAPYSCGTSLFAHKKTGLRNENDFAEAGNDVFSETGFYDRSKFELVDTAGNVFNRLVLFDAKSIHSANEYFGSTKENSRLFHLFFFD